MVNREPTIIVQQYRDAAKKASNSNSYRGLRIHALPGLHDYLGNICTKHLSPGSKIIDLAAGSGAMSVRLKDLGLEPTAVDYVTENFRATEIPFLQVDLNQDFSELFVGEKYQAILASEIIEHLENPRHFFRQCSKILADTGVLILSTPNLQNSGSIASFARTGSFLWFSDSDYELQGHISPLSAWQIEHCLTEAGFSLIWSGSFGKGASRLAGSPRLTMLAKLIDSLSGIPVEQRGEIYVCVAAKQVQPTDPDTVSTGDPS